MGDRSAARFFPTGRLRFAAMIPGNRSIPNRDFGGADRRRSAMIVLLPEAVASRRVLVNRSRFLPNRGGLGIMARRGAAGGSAHFARQDLGWRVGGITAGGGPSGLGRMRYSEGCCDRWSRKSPARVAQSLARRSYDRPWPSFKSGSWTIFWSGSELEESPESSCNELWPSDRMADLSNMIAGPMSGSLTSVLAT